MTWSASIPELDPTRCVSSGGCVAVCPTGCLEMAGAVVWLPRPADCVGCGACEVVCPTAAIRLPAVTRPAAPAG